MSAAVDRERRRQERERAPEVHATAISKEKARLTALRDPTRKPEHWTERWARKERKRRQT